MTDRTIARTRPECRPALRDYAVWLESECGLLSSSIKVRVDSARVFLHDVVPPGKGGCVRWLRALDAAAIEQFFVQFASKAGQGARLSMRATLRRFLQFSGQRGWVSRDLAEAVPSWRAYRLAGLPHGLSVEDARRLLASLPHMGEAALRDRALIVLLTSYGVRRCQLAGLRLGDVDWPRNRIAFGPYKGGKGVTHTLTSQARDALAAYLIERRASPTEPHVFCRVRRPLLALGPPAITGAIQSRLARAGIEGRRLGPHAFRHAFATRLLEARLPLKTIADLLGHRRLESTMIYAKVDRPQLAEAALPWPEVLQ